MKRLKNLMKTVDIGKNNTCFFISFQFFMYPSCPWLLPLLLSEESDLMVKQANLNRDVVFAAHTVILKNVSVK